MCQQSFMKNINHIVILLLISTHFLGQTNLVINPSFETFTVCPTYEDNIIQAIGWTSYKESPDYFNACSVLGLGTPTNVTGYQIPHSGVGYGGFFAYDNAAANTREIIGGALTQTLNIGQTYYVSAYFALAEIKGISPKFIPCNNIGVKFSTIPFSTITPVPINNFAHIYSSQIISDTMNWTKISGSFIADSNYKYLMIGNFFDDANTDTINRPSGTRSYFFVDDICVSTNSLTCPIINSVKTNENIDGIKIYPNPANSFLYIDNVSNKNINISINDVIGVELYKCFTETGVQIDLSSLPPGMVFVKIQQDNNSFIKKIIIRN